jgi:tetratricopeptide (TPR) repeat protein
MALLGQTWKALGQQDQAIEAFRAALDHDPRNGVARGALGV